MNGVINHSRKTVLLWLCAGALSLFSSFAASTVVTVEPIQCSFDPDSGKSNPFGTSAFITVTQNGSDTHFRYERFAQLVQLKADGEPIKVRAVTIENNRSMIFYNTEIEVARELMRTNNAYYFELIGYADPDGFSSYDDAMSCG